MKKIMCAILVIFGIFLGAFQMHDQAFAAGTGMGFEVYPAQSDSQVNNKVTYYDLKLNPGETTELAIKVKNTSDKPIVVNTAIGKGTTSTSGLGVYKQVDNKSIDLPYNIEKYVTTKTAKIDLGVDESKKVIYTVKMPDKAFDGVLAGGMTFLKKADASDKSKGMSIANQFSYTISLVLHGKKDLDENKVTLGKVKADQLNGRNAITMPIQNETAAYLSQVKTNVKVSKKGSDQVLYKQSGEKYQIVPNSVFNLPVRIGEVKFKAGDYTANVEVQSKGQKWHFTRDFTITNDEANQLNKTALVKEDNTWLYILFACIGITLLILLFSIIYVRKQRKIKVLKAELEKARE